MTEFKFTAIMNALTVSVTSRRSDMWSKTADQMEDNF